MQDRSIVPMINVVFLLLVFFLLSASLAPPEPLEITPPLADGAQSDRQPGTLYVDAEGALAYGAASGDAVWGVLNTHDGPLPLRVDATYPASDLAALIARLAESDLSDIRLLSVRP